MENGGWRRASCLRMFRLVLGEGPGSPTSPSGSASGDPVALAQGVPSFHQRAPGAPKWREQQGHLGPGPPFQNPDTVICPTWIPEGLDRLVPQDQPFIP
eukprot:2337619-Pyramimonas_sp.AAC.1